MAFWASGGVFTESKASAHDAGQSQGPRNQPGGPRCALGGPGVQCGGGEAVGEGLSFGTFENRQMHAFHSDSGSSPAASE